jgi:short-subunit dehydrogenase
MAVYAATKAFLVSMMTSLAVEFKKTNVVFTNVCPGGMATNDAMKESIKSMGLGGKLSTLSSDKVAKIALKALKRKKKNVVTGGFNKFLVLISKPFSKSFLAKSTGKIWKKSQAKRGF